MLTGYEVLVRCSQNRQSAHDTYAGGVVGGKGDGLCLSVGDRVGHVREGQDSRLGSRERSEGADKKSLGEHLVIWLCVVDGGGVVERRTKDSRRKKRLRA